MSYLSIQKLDNPGVKAHSVSLVFDKEQVPFHSIDCVNWTDYPYKPDVKFRIAHNGTNIFLNYQVEETDIHAKGNFYKCGDKLKTPHFLSWNPVKNEQPDFHLPQFFGEFFFNK